MIIIVLCCLLSMLSTHADEAILSKLFSGGEKRNVPLYEVTNQRVDIPLVVNRYLECRSKGKNRRCYRDLIELTKEVYLAMNYNLETPDVDSIEAIKLCQRKDRYDKVSVLLNRELRERVSPKKYKLINLKGALLCREINRHMQKGYLYFKQDNISKRFINGGMGRKKRTYGTDPVNMSIVYDDHKEMSKLRSFYIYLAKCALSFLMQWYDKNKIKINWRLPYFFKGKTCALEQVPFRSKSLWKLGYIEGIAFTIIGGKLVKSYEMSFYDEKGKAYLRLDQHYEPAADIYTRPRLIGIHLADDTGILSRFMQEVKR